MSKITRTDLDLARGHLRHEFKDVKHVSFDGTTLSFTHGEAVYQTTYAFLRRDVTSLSCGHSLENYWEEDAGNAGCWDRCRECDRLEKEKSND